jgi:hypothetical protein
MPARVLHGLHRRLPALGVVSALLAAPAFAAGPTPTPTPVPSLKTKVQVVEVIKDGSTIRVDPDRVKLKRKTDVVVWVTNGLDLRVEFKKTNPAPGNPFTDLTCRGRFCGVLNPPDVEPNAFRYSVTVDGQTLDPTVEVVP